MVWYDMKARQGKVEYQKWNIKYQNFEHCKIVTWWTFCVHFFRNAIQLVIASASNEELKTRIYAYPAAAVQRYPRCKSAENTNAPIWRKVRLFESSLLLAWPIRCRFVVAIAWSAWALTPRPSTSRRPTQRAVHPSEKKECVLAAQSRSARPHDNRRCDGRFWPWTRGCRRRACARSLCRSTASCLVPWRTWWSARSRRCARRTWPLSRPRTTGDPGSDSSGNQPACRTCVRPCWADTRTCPSRGRTRRSTSRPASMRMANSRPDCRPTSRNSPA